ncbi:MAG: hypothetical protein RLZZ622_544, partial [Planctomycetota bacterium]
MKAPETVPPRCGWRVRLAFVAVLLVVAGSGASCPGVLRGYQVGIMPLP